MNIKATIRRINRKYRQFVNYFVNAVIIFSIGWLFLGHAQTLIGESNASHATEYASLKEALASKQDSIFLEIDKLKIGVDEATTRRFKITTAAEIIKDVRRDSISESDALQLATIFYDEAERSGIDLSFVLAVGYVESRFNHKSTSSVGAQGIMQVMPLTFTSIAKLHGYDYLEDDVKDLKKNIRIGTIFLHRLVNSFGSYDLASAGYNGGPRVALNYKMLAAGDTTAAVPVETQKYVVAVGKYRNIYKKKLGE